MRGRFRRTLFLFHLYVGLTLGIGVSLIGLTGSLLVFRHEIDVALTPAHLRGTPGATRVPLQKVVDAAQNTRPGIPIQHLFVARSAGEPHEVWLKGSSVRIYVDPATGVVLGTRDAEQTPMGFLFSLHTKLLSGERGETVVGVIGLLLFLLSVTGLFLWWPRSWKLVRSHLTVKWRAGMKRIVYDLHRVVGLYASAVLVLLSLTGAALVFPELFASLAYRATKTQPPGKKPEVVPSPTSKVLSLDVLLRRAEAVLPGGQLTRISFPAKPTAPLVVRKKFAAETHPNGTNFVYLDPFRGNVLQVEQAQRASAGRRLMDIRYPLHIGAWGGGVTRVLFAVAGLTPGILFVTGCLMWWNRGGGKRRRRAPLSQEPVEENNAHSLPSR